MDLSDPHDEIARLEARIEELAARIEGCRKFMVASRIAIAIGGALLAAAALGAVWLSAAAMTAAIAAILGGIVVLGSNRSTANEARAQMAAADQSRSALIAGLEFRTVTEDKAAGEPHAARHWLH